MLKKFHAKSDSEIDTINVSQDHDGNALKLYEDQLKELKETLAEKSRILRDWSNPNNIEDLSQIKIMENHLIASLNRIRNNKGSARDEDT
ncbi:hypothetical protein PTKIN_Ptkin03bG0215200 [Pterospermum kingtungense]